MLLSEQVASIDAVAARPLLEVRNLGVGFRTRRGLVTAVHDISFSLSPGETVCLIGESGSGKSVTGLAIAGLLPRDREGAGEILYDGRDLLKLGDAHMRQLRGKEIAMVVQDAMTALDPVYSIGEQIVETLLAHQSIGRRAARAAAIEMLDLVGIPDPVRRMDSFPHELSGGMKQRAVIAIAVICQPRLLIADEPTTALDVTIQAQIIALLRRLQQQLGMAMLFITHDLGVVAQIADKVVVVYSGRVVEAGEAGSIYHRPSMPYTRALIELAPHVDRAHTRGARLPAIAGTVPDPGQAPPGCAFAPRCPLAIAQCTAAMPPLLQVDAGHVVRCHRHEHLAPFLRQGASHG